MTREMSRRQRGDDGRQWHFDSVWPLVGLLLTMRAAWATARVLWGTECMQRR